METRGKKRGEDQQQECKGGVESQKEGVESEKEGNVRQIRRKRQRKTSKQKNGRIEDGRRSKISDESRNINRKEERKKVNEIKGQKWNLKESGGGGINLFFQWRITQSIHLDI